MTEQIQTPPTHFDVQKYWGPFFANITLADDVTNALIKMTDKIIDDKKSKSHGQSLAGVIDKELRIYKSDMDEFGVDQMLESVVRSYVIHCAKMHSYFHEDWFYESFINSAWVVSQYENEYNPLHNHTGCDISGVIYLKTPKIKGRRNIESKKGKDDNDGDITFVHSAMGQRNHDILEKGIFTITPQVGQMVLFPSYLLHTVYPFIGKGERRCIAFNAVYRIGDKNKNFMAGDLSGVQNPTFYTKEKGKS
jgi:uncharacterized protein (TIGR02466 family)